MKVLSKIFRAAIRNGRVTLVGAGGQEAEFGGQGPGPEVRLRLADASFDKKILLNPELKAAEGIMNGQLVLEEGSIHDFIELFFINKRQFDMNPNQIFWNGLSRRLRRFMQHNTLRNSRRNVEHHYDLGNDFYRMWLGHDLQYSCGYFPLGTETLDEAQTAKKRHIAAKMALEPGQTVLDIGCGWGGMALYLAAVADVKVVGVTLAEEQLKVARARAEYLGLGDRVEFCLQDYRDVTETFDRVVSVGMLEHVGVSHLTEYYLNVRNRLKPDGVALIHSVSSKAPPGITGPFLRKYIFPGGYSPSLSEAFAAVERSGLWTLDTEIWRVHYAHTLAAWRERFMAQRETVVGMYDERFAKMWEIYLSACECAFSHGASCNFQMQLGRERDAVPLSRGYIEAAEAQFKVAEGPWLDRLHASTAAAFGD
jgi:cyclopropane-fatty-acyl-phospholipid synthase